MSAENHGTGMPEGDDPFAYLYRQEGGAADSGAAAQQPGVPRRSYNQVRAVGERQYPQQGRQTYGSQAHGCLSAAEHQHQPALRGPRDDAGRPGGHPAARWPGRRCRRAAATTTVC